MVRIQVPLREEVIEAYSSLADNDQRRLIRRLHAKISYYRRMRKGNIFISHSTSDLHELIDPAALRIRSAGLEPYIASLRVAGKNPAEKILEAISSSEALFAIITRNVTEQRRTRDWVLFEIGAAKSLRKSVFGWKARDATVPEPIKQITDYSVFDAKKPKEVEHMLDMIDELARSLPTRRSHKKRSRVH